MSDFKLVKLVGTPFTLNILINPKGEYDSLTEYNVGDSVSYGTSSYIARTSTLGNLPTDTTYWQLLAEGTSISAIEDTVGAMFIDTSTIDFTFNTVSNQISAIIQPSSITDTQINKISPTKIEDAYNKTHESTVNTTNSTVTDIYSLNLTTDCSILAETKIVGRRTGGTSGTAGDAATFIRSFRIKSIGGVITIHDVQSDYTSRDNASWTVLFQVIGASVVFRVRGAANNNIQWIMNLTTGING